MEPDPPPWWFVAGAAVVIAALGIAFIVRGEPIGFGLLAVAVGWAAFACIARRRAG